MYLPFGNMKRMKKTFPFFAKCFGFSTHHDRSSKQNKEISEAYGSSPLQSSHATVEWYETPATPNPTVAQYFSEIRGWVEKQPRHLGCEERKGCKDDSTTLQKPQPSRTVSYTLIIDLGSGKDIPESKDDISPTFTFVRDEDM